MASFYRHLIFLCFFGLFAQALLGEDLQPPAKSNVNHEDVRHNAQMDQSSPFDTSDQNGGVMDNSHFTKEFVKMLFFLGLIIAFMIAGSWFLKRMVNVRIQQTNEQSEIKVIEHRGLSTKTTLYLLEIEGKQILIGETAHGVVSLAQFEKQKET